MNKKIFATEMARLAAAFGEHQFSPAKIDAYWKFFERDSEKDFSEAVTQAILGERMAPTAQRLKEFMPDRLSQNKLGTETFDRLHPPQADAKALAEKYAPKIREHLKKCFGDLPYNKLEREEE